MILKVCVGSSCHLKGSYDVIEQMKAVLKKYDVEDVVELQASFCLGYCAQGVTMKSENYSENQNDELFLHNVNKDNAEEIFVRDVYPLIKER